MAAHTTPETRARIADMLRAGASQNRIRRELGCGIWIIRNVRSAEGIPLPDGNATELPEGVKHAMRDLIEAGENNREIGRRLGIHYHTVAIHRKRLGLPNAPHRHPHGISLEDHWQQKAVTVDGGHMQWTGYSRNGLPFVIHENKPLSARRIAFRMRTGRDPIGNVLPDCGEPWCVAPGHVDDRPGREATARALAAIGGAL